MDEKEKILNKILENRNELEAINESINELGKSVSFINLILMPFVVALIVTFLTALARWATNQAIGAILITFILSFALSAYLNRKKINDRKKILIDARLRKQKEIVELSKKLSEISN